MHELIPLVPGATCTVCGGPAILHPDRKKDAVEAFENGNLPCALTEVEVLHDEIIGLRENESELTYLVGYYVDPVRVDLHESAPRWGDVVRRCQQDVGK